MAGHSPWRGIRHKRDQDWWSDLRFRHRAKDREAAADAVERLIVEAERLGFEFELASTGLERPGGEVLPSAPSGDTGK